MKRPTLWRYYGLTGLIALAILTMFLLRMIANKYQVEWLLKWGYKGAGSLWLGFCLLLGGLDRIVLRKEYPPFLRQNAPTWDVRAQWTSPLLLFCQGIVAALLGIMAVCTGAGNLLDALSEVVPK
jgi:hypothetical protein